MFERFRRRPDDTATRTAVLERERVERDSDVDEPATHREDLAEQRADTDAYERGRTEEDERLRREETVHDREQPVQEPEEPIWEPVRERRTMAPLVERETLRDMRARQREHFGGVNWGSAFFGLLCAIGLGSILTAILVAAGVAIGLSDVEQAVNSDTAMIDVGGGILLLVGVAIAWYCGGYVAGRMSRFDGVRQGVAVWLWTLLIGAAVVAAAAIGGSEYNLLERLNLPTVPIDSGTLTTGGAIALGASLAVTLVAAVLGGKIGERYHRRVDRVATDDYVVER